MKAAFTCCPPSADLRARWSNAHPAHALPLRVPLGHGGGDDGRRPLLDPRARSLPTPRGQAWRSCVTCAATCPGSRLLVVWDGSPIHRHKARRAFRLSPEAEGFVFESLPGYAPDLNPLDTGIWHHLKDVALANVCCHGLQALREKLAAAILGLRRRPRLIHAAFANAELSLG